MHHLFGILCTIEERISTFVEVSELNFILRRVLRVKLNCTLIDAAGMATGVRASLIEIFENEGHEKGQEYLDFLRAQKRFGQDVW
jgi:hypothetical protein